MRILVLQLARFGDIYQTWPVLRALRRKNPDAELHILVRERFQAALDGLEGVSIHALPTAEILKSIYETGEESGSLNALSEFIEPLRAIEFDRVINLTFSPLSSYLTDWIAGPGADVRGYTRHADGHFHIPDDTSAYFYAQVGIGRPNRYHVTDLFGAVAGADLVDEDFAAVARTRHGIVIQLGASEQNKTYPPELWVEVLRKLQEPVTLIGSADERALSETVVRRAGGAHVNRVGETKLAELFEIIGGARVLICADSAPVHIASLTATPTLNLSSDTVNFWETGPLAAGSRVLYSPKIDSILPGDVAAHAHGMLTGAEPSGPCAIREQRGNPLRLSAFEVDSFPWRLIEALYTGTDFPAAETQADRLAFQRLFELAELALQQLGVWSRSKDSAARILAEIDGLIPAVADLNPRIAPVVNWFQTQRLRIPPGNDHEVFEKTQAAFQDLYWVTAVYRPMNAANSAATRAAALCREISPAAYEYDLAPVNDKIQELMSVLHELARHSTKVAGAPWSSVLGSLQNSLERRDYVEFADMLNWSLAPVLESQATQSETSPTDVIS